jgi:gliding motility-associated-like protein
LNALIIDAYFCPLILEFFLKTVDMFKKFLPIILCLTYGLILNAQKPESLLGIEPSLNTRASSAVCTGAANAGITTRTKGLSAKLRTDTRFLCANDSLFVANSGSNLSEDPRKATTPGIGYIFYDCPPTRFGPRWSDIKSDPCIKKTPLNGVPPTLGLYVARGDSTGRDTFVNNGSLQRGFNNGKPLKLYFGAATIYRFNGVNPDAEGDTACVNVSVLNQSPADSFSVVYLNPVAISNLAYVTGGGSFTVSGGLPEYDGVSQYTITIRQVGNPSVLGTVTGTARHNGTINFTVPSNGEYQIVAVDGKSCDASVTVTLPAVTFILSNEKVAQNQEACVKFTAKDFTNIGAFQFDIVYDPTILRYKNIQRISPLFSGFSPATTNLVSPGILGFLYSIASGVTVPDNTVLFEICFDAIGANGTVSPVQIVPPQSQPLEVGDAASNPLGFSLIQGSVKIGDILVSYNLNADSVRCSGESTGGLRIKPTATTGAPFTYKWTRTTGVPNGSGTIATLADSAIVSSLTAGTYSVTVTNSTQDSLVKTILVGEPLDPLFVNPPDVRNPCPGGNNGKMFILSSGIGGGTAPYSFLWSTGATRDSIVNLSPGNYSCTVSDARGCTAQTSGSIGGNAIRVVDSLVTPALCSDRNDGALFIRRVTGGTALGGNYTFKWNNLATSNKGATSNNPNLKPGIYTVLITDDNSCSVTKEMTVPAQRVLSMNPTVTNPLCSGANDGSVFVDITERGTSNRPYLFTWTGVPITNVANNPATSLARNLVAGSYPLSVRDQDGCKIDSTFVLTQPDSIRIDSVSLTNESCSVGSDGRIVISATGGAGGYTYRWSRGNTDVAATISNLVAGSYTVTVTDSRGCLKTRSFQIQLPQRPALTAIVRNATCFERADGFAKINITPPTGASVTSIQWSNAGILDSITGVSAGVYQVTVSLNNGCSKDTAITVSAPDSVSIDLVNSSVVNPTCPEDKNGQIILVMKGGTAPYKYSLSGQPAVTGSVFGSLGVGNYAFTITDANNCKPVAVDIPLVGPPDIVVAYANIVETSCNGACLNNQSNGRATAIASGGSTNTGVYTYRWSSGETVGNATRLCAGFQRVTVSDGTCFKVDSVQIPEPLPLTFLSQIITEPTCNGDKDGSAEVRIQGGTAPYSYAWSTGGTSKEIINVTAGLYNVTVTDARLCTAIPLTVEILEPQRLILDTIATETNNVTCNALEDGQITLRRIGGNGGDTQYKWAGNISQTEKAINLKAGVYTITATDVKGCNDDFTITLTQPDPITFSLAPILPPRCFGEETFIKLDTAFGSTYLHPFTISIDNGPQYPVKYEVPVFADEHLVTITEQVTGCTDTLGVFIPQPPAITIGFNNIIDSVPIARMLVGLGDSVRLDPIINSALPIDSVRWTPRDYLVFTADSLRPFIRPLDDRTYTLRVVDVNGCVADAQLAVDLERNRNVFIPNIFSPNDDDRNDYFAPFTGVGVKSVNFLRVFDRWGELLFERRNLPLGDDPSKGWDGKFNGNYVQSGVYVYTIEITFEDSNTTLLYRGDVTVIR